MNIHPITDYEKEYILSHSEAPRKVLCKHLNMSDDRLKRLMVMLGINPFRNQGAPINHDNEDEIRDLYVNQNMSTTDVATALDISVGRVRMVVERLKLKHLPEFSKVLSAKHSKESLTGKRFGRLLVGEHVRTDDTGHKFYQCKCDCGNYHVVSAALLKSGGVRSCGCLAKDVRRERSKNAYSYDRLYGIWHGMTYRCYNPKSSIYKHYGQRGIRVCAEWKDNYFVFKEWALSNGYSNDLTIERVDVNGNYCPDNCIWATMKRQQNNRRNNHLITYEGRTQTLTQWAEEFGISGTVLRRHLRDGIFPPTSESLIVDRQRYVEYQGLCLSIQEWAKRLGVNRNTFRGWVRKGKFPPKDGSVIKMN